MSIVGPEGVGYSECGFEKEKTDFAGWCLTYMYM